MEPTAKAADQELHIDGMAVSIPVVGADTTQSPSDDSSLVQLGGKVSQKSKSKESSDLNSQGSGSRPAILLTGATHSRELITIQTVLFTALRMIHKAIIAKEKKYQNLLMQNVYYVIPVINVDGLNLIEQEFSKTQKILNKRKNMNKHEDLHEAGSQFLNCSDAMSGVDLNRNWGVDFGLA